MSNISLKNWYPAIPLTCSLLYVTQGLIIPEGSVYSRILLVVFMLFAMGHGAVVFTKYRNSLVNIITFFVFIQFLYFINAESFYWRMDGEKMSPQGNMISIIFTFSLFYVFYFYALKGKLQEKHLIIYVFCFIVLSVPRYIYTEMKMIETMLLHGWYADDVTNNTAYYFLEAFAFIPLIFSKRYISIVVMATIGFFILNSSKRGAIFIFALCLLYYLPLFLKKNKKIVFALIPILVALGYWAFAYFSQNAYLVERLVKTTEGYSSGRDEIYESIINYCLFDHFDIVNFLFGYGFNYSIKIAGNVAHNDWLELLSCCGLFGILIYLSIFLTLYRYIKKINNDTYKRTMYLCLIIIFLRTFFSMTYTSTVLIFSIIGFVLGIEKRNEQNQIAS